MTFGCRIEGERPWGLILPVLSRPDRCKYRNTKIQTVPSGICNLRRFGVLGPFGLGFSV